MKKLLTDIELRAHWSQTRSRAYYVEEGTMLTPAAKDFIRENAITLCYVEGCGQDAGPCPAPPGPGPLYAGNPSVWDRAKASGRPAPVVSPSPLYRGNPTVWRRDGAPLPTATDYPGNPAVWTRPAPKQEAPAAMTTQPIPTAQGKARYQIAGTGQSLDHKPEEMTHLRGNLLVPKTHPRIAFRGKLDSLIARFLEVQLLAKEKGDTAVVSDLEDLLGFLQAILAAEVKEQPLGDVVLLGMPSEAVRDVSHHVQREFGIPHPIPSHKMGRLCVALNSLRAQVREGELAAAQAFSQEGTFTRPDLIEGLNRLSSAVYIIFCRQLSGWYEKGGTP